MRAHRHEHELVVQIVLPKEHLGLRFIRCQAHITSNTITSTEDITTIFAPQDDLTLSFVNDTEAGQFRVVLDICIIEQPMLQGNGRLAGSEVDDAE